MHIHPACGLDCCLAWLFHMCTPVLSEGTPKYSNYYSQLNLGNLFNNLE